MVGVTLDNRVAFSIFQQIAQPDIFIMELLAGALLSIVLRHIHGDSSPPLPWLWITDSSVAKFAMLKGHSASPLADEVLRFWFKWGTPPSHVMQVPSGCMRADFLTRPELYKQCFDELSCCSPARNGKYSHDVHTVPVGSHPILWNK